MNDSINTILFQYGEESTPPELRGYRMLLAQQIKIAYEEACQEVALAAKGENYKTKELRWVLSNEQAEGTSFLLCCRVLELDPQWVRRVVGKRLLDAHVSTASKHPEGYLKTLIEKLIRS